MFSWFCDAYSDFLLWICSIGLFILAVILITTNPIGGFLLILGGCVLLWMAIASSDSFCSEACSEIDYLVGGPEEMEEY